jgi:hypothetical protein
VSFLFRTWPDGSQTGSIDPSHKGSCAVYMKHMGLITSVGGHGPGVSLCHLRHRLWQLTSVLVVQDLR